MKPTPVRVNGHLANTGAPVHGVGMVRTPVPVQSYPLDDEGVCEALDDPDIRVRHSGSSDVYERNVLRGKHGCG